MRRLLLGSLIMAGLAATARAQCSPSIAPISDKGHEPLPAGITIPANTFIQASYPLNGDDRLLIYSQTTEIGPHVVGIVISRKDGTPQVLTVDSFFSKQDQSQGYTDSYYALAIAKGCSESKPIYFTAFHWDGDIISPELVLTIVPSGTRYIVSAMPLISGGVLEISRSDARSLKEWSNLNEGECNACETPYEIRTFTLRGGRPVQLHRYRTRRRYTSGDRRFDEPEMRFVP